MSRARALALAVAGLAAHALLATGAGAALPPWLRLGLAFAALILLPGAALLAWIEPPAGGAWLALPWALGLGVAWNGLLVLAVSAAGLRFTVLAPGAIATTAALWAAALAHPRRPAGAPPGDAAPLPGVALALVLLAAAFAAWHVGRLGTPITYFTDSPDHVGTIRRMLEHGNPFPPDAFFRDAGPLGADPRKGLWHPEVALLARLSSVDPFDVWRMLPGLIAPLFVLTAAGLGRRISGAPGAVIGAWALPFTYAGTLAGYALREAGFATKLADQLAIVTVTAALADLTAPGARSRLAVVGLALGAVATHVFAALQLAITLGALALGLAIRDRGARPAARRLLGTSVLAGLACLPYAAWRGALGAGASNVIHTEPQGLLTLADGARVVMPGVLWEWLGDLWVLIPLAWIPLWRWDRGNPGALLLLTTTVAVALVIFDPPVVALLEPHIGYLLMRMVWLVPLAGLVAWLLPACAARLRRPGGGWAPGPAALLALTVALLAIAVQDGLGVVLHPGRQRAATRVEDIGRWRGALTRLDRALPPDEVVLADPATSYAVPAFTRDYVVTLVDQHSSPSDSLALRRIMDARDALDPYGSWERATAVIERYHVDLVLVNEDFLEIPPFDYWAPSPAWAARVKARFASRPDAFEKVFEDDGFTAFRVRRGALASLHGAPPRPQAVPWDPRRAPIARRLGPDLPVIQDLRLSPRRAAPGDTVRGVADWRAPGPLQPGSYRVMVRFDRALPGGLEPPSAISKPVRKLIERLRGERYRFRTDHLPTAGAYGVDLWGPGEVVRDSFELIVPRDVAPGDYLVRVQMVRQAHYPNLRLSDYFSDMDRLAGVPMGVFRVQRPGEPLPPEAVRGAEGGH